ncbi:hypothetical protein R1flu_013802 [Riccia fluitans]|uniref:Uncharacterized protein n=1 Tax=Riccia fluitans TaxID=41844 RepID=A0ABD1YEB3_9MARC
MEGVTEAKGGVTEPKAENMEGEEGVTEAEGGVTKVEARNMEVEGGVTEPHLEELRTVKEGLRKLKKLSERWSVWLDIILSINYEAL